MPELGGWRGPGEFLTAFGDGSVHAMRNVEEETMKRWIEKADGKPIPTPAPAQP